MDWYKEHFQAKQMKNFVLHLCFFPAPAPLHIFYPVGKFLPPAPSQQRRHDWSTRILRLLSAPARADEIPVLPPKLIHCKPESIPDIQPVLVPYKDDQAFP